MKRKHEYFAHAANAELTGEQARVFLCLLSEEHDGAIWLKQKEVAERLNIAESNVSRSIKALKKAGLISQTDAEGCDGMPMLQLESNFDTAVSPIVDCKQLDPDACESLLYDASSVFIRELYLVHASLLVFRIVGLNARSFSGSGAEYVHFSSLLAQRAIVLGLENLFERKDEGAGLCSVKGLLQIAQRLKLKNKSAAETFVRKYEVEPTDDWYSDVQTVLEKQAPLVGQCVKHTSRLRNQRVAHLSHPPLKPRQFLLPSVGTTEQVISFAHDFYTFIVTGFLNCANGAELRNSIGESLFSLLKDRFGVPKAKYDFPNAATEAK